MAESVQMTLGKHSVVVQEKTTHTNGTQVHVDIWVDGDDMKMVLIAMCQAEARAFHAALGSIIESIDRQDQVYVEKAKAEWRMEE